MAEKCGKKIELKVERSFLSTSELSLGADGGVRPAWPEHTRARLFSGRLELTIGDTGLESTIQKVFSVY